MDKLGKIIKAVLPLVFLYVSYWFVGFIPISYVYYPDFSVYHEKITIFCILAFVLTFLVIAVGVFNIRSVKRLGVIFLLYQPIKLVVDLTGLLYESKYLNIYIFQSVNFLAIFIWLGSSVVVIRNKEDGQPPFTNIAKFLIRCIPVSLISVSVPILENIIVRCLLNQTLPYGAAEIFNVIVFVMSVSIAALTIMLGIFMQASNAALDGDFKLISIETLKPLIFSMLFSIAVPILWRLMNIA